MHAAESPEEVKSIVEPLKDISPTNSSCGVENGHKTNYLKLIFRKHNLEPHFSAKLVLIKASLNFELLARAQVQTCHLHNTFIHINPTDQKPLSEYFKRAVMTRFMQPSL